VLTNRYNDITKYYIYRFVEEFIYLYPNFLTREELYNRINNSIRENIVFGKLSDDVVGAFIPRTGTIICNSNLDDKKLDSGLFHEFVHAITLKKNSNDYFLVSNYNGEKLLESIVSSMKYDFNAVKYGEDKYNTTEYVSDYAKQLEAVFGDSFLRTFIRNFTDISSLFDFNGGNLLLKRICHNVNELHYCIYNSNLVEKIDYINFCLENDIAITLCEFLKTSKLSVFEKLERIDKLYSLQKSPNLDIYISMINSCCIDARILKCYPNLIMIYRIYNGVLDDSVQLKDKVSRFMAMKTFGFNHMIDNKRYEDSLMKEFFENQIHYTSLTNAVYQKDLNIKEVSNGRFESINGSNNFSSFILAHKLRYGSNVSSYYDSFSNFSKIKTKDNSFYIENYDGNVLVYKACDLPSIVTMLFMSGNFVNAIKSILSLIKENVNTVYYPVTLGGELNVFNDLNKLKIIYEKDDKMIVEEFGESNFHSKKEFWKNRFSSLKNVNSSYSYVKRR